jgi:hypothetical protein
MSFSNLLIKFLGYNMKWSKCVYKSDKYIETIGDISTASIRKKLKLLLGKAIYYT